LNPSNKLLSDIIAFRTYAKFLPHLGRRESLEETINRNMTMHLDRFPKLSRDILKAYQKVHELKVLPSMRAMQFSGPAVLKNNLRQYNCSYLNIDDIRAFGETMFLLLSGTGVGYSVQSRHISQLPKVTLPKEEGYFLAHDSIMGWAQCVDVLFEAYFLGRIRPQFDFSAIRPKGSYLVTTGSQAPGPEPLKYALNLVEEKLKLAVGRKLLPLEIHDIICILSDAVLAGGIRRAALISLFDRDDTQMLKCKSGEWWVKAPWRARANNSVVLKRGEVTQEEFTHIYNLCRESNAGEPGFFWTNDYDVGGNPCMEIALNSNQLCNLTTINQSNLTSEKDFLDRVYSATLIGTLQAAYTDFPYVREKWRQVTESEALLGVSFTGIADSNGFVTKELLKKASALALEVNEKYAHKIGIKMAARIGTVKPEGSASCVLGSSSGIHSRHAEHYIRRVRMNKNDPLAIYLGNTIPDLVENDATSSSGIVVSIPQESPENALTRHKETALTLFNRALFYRKNWIEATYREGVNHHNVSVTISLKENEWEPLLEKMWEKRESYNGISLLPFDDSSYKQMPFEECSKETYENTLKLVKGIDLKLIKEESDNTNRIEQLACVGGVCVIEV